MQAAPEMKHERNGRETDAFRDVRAAEIRVSAFRTCAS